MKQNVIEKTLEKIAKAACESTSMFSLHEPKVPEQLLKKEEQK